jgi:DNA-binding CsgD family transcriptional regulator
MPPRTTRPLTERQAAVMDRVDRRVPIKVIAQELGVSETRINQHIRALKDIYGAASLVELVDLYRLDQQSEHDGDEPDESVVYQSLDLQEGPLSEAAYRNSQVPLSVFGFDMGDRDMADTVEFKDVTPLIERAPWLRPGEPKVVPGLLDGEHAVMLRLAAIVGIAFGVLAAVVLTATAAMMISDALNGRAVVPVDEQAIT